jgi:hypothetical protein
MENVRVQLRRRGPGGMSPGARTSILCLLTLPWTVLGAQEAVAIRPAPQPGRTLHVRTTQELSVSISPDGAPARATAQQLATRSVLEYRQSNGQFDPQDRMEAQLTLESVEAEEILNGVTQTPKDLDQLAGRAVTVVFDRAGTLLDVRVPRESGHAAATLKFLIGGAYGALSFLPAATLALGDTATFPSQLPLQLPQAGSAAPFRTRTTITLRTIDGSGRGRLAHFQQRIESAEAGGPLEVQGTGTVDVNLAGGFIAASRTEWTFTGVAPGAGGATQPGPIRATVRITVTASE